MVLVSVPLSTTAPAIPFVLYVVVCKGLMLLLSRPLNNCQGCSACAFTRGVILSAALDKLLVDLPSEVLEKLDIYTFGYTHLLRTTGT